MECDISYGTHLQPNSHDELEYLVGVCDATLPCIEDDELVGLGVGVHDGLKVALVLFAAAV